MKKSYSIKSLEVNNFKCIENFTFDFEQKRLIVLDGPNGYGKTTLFDAIEILFVGKLRKIDENNNIDLRIAFDESSIHFNDENSIILKLELKSDEESIIIRRTFEPATNKRNSKKKNPKAISISSKLEVSIDDGVTFNETTTEILAKDILEYENIKNLFNVLNYVEQDENTYFLKKSPKDKYKGLISLLGIESQQNKLEKLEKFQNKLTRTISDYEEKKNNIETSNQNILTQTNKEIEYKKILQKQDVIWDLKSVIISSIEIRDVFLAEIQEVKELKSNFNQLKKIVYLKEIENFLNDEFINNLIRYYWFFQNMQLLEVEHAKRITSLLLLTSLNDAKTNIVNFNADYWIDESLDLNFLNTHNLISDYEGFIKKTQQLKILKNNLSEQNKIIVDLKTKRDSFISSFVEHNHSEEIKFCPTCGHDWESYKKLVEAFDQTAFLLNESLSESLNSYEEYEKSIKEVEFKELELKLTELIREIKIDDLITENDYLNLIPKQRLLSPLFNAFFELVDSETKQQINQLINHRKIEIENTNALIQEIINNSLPALENEINPSTLYKAFEKYFDKNFETLINLSDIDIIAKGKYVEYLYFNSINELLTHINEKLFFQNKLKTDTVDIIAKIKVEIENYIRSIISTISIPFYIYSGKILQEHTLGTGLVFNANLRKSDPELKITPLGKTQEASYILSSGQLSATVMALTLVLNKVYNTSKLALILIDDPLQTLDEINTHSLVEVLKYNFSDQQLILSTHEDRYSKFIRYKYDKFGLSEKNISMKEVI